MARFLIFLDGLPPSVERRAIVHAVSIEDCHSTRGYSVASSHLSADALLQKIIKEAIRRGAREVQLRVVVLRLDEIATRGARLATEDCF